MTSFDARADDMLEVFRRHRVTARLFHIASTVGDFSAVWHIAGIIYALSPRGEIQHALALSLALGVESLIVNQGIKKLFRRQRPTESGDHRFDIRTPSTSSFPSGHASSATFAAILLTSFTGFPLAVVWITIAAVVALSRVVVRIHHFSDILGGIVTGAALGAIALPFVTLLVT